jgi:hypothetical protein
MQRAPDAQMRSPVTGQGDRAQSQFLTFFSADENATSVLDAQALQARKLQKSCAVCRSTAFAVASLAFGGLPR